MPREEFLLDGQIIKYTVENESRQEIEAWANMVIHTGNDWPKNKPYCVVMDFRNANVLTSNIRTFTEQVNDYFDELGLVGVNIAVLIKKNIVSNLAARVFIERQLPQNAFHRKTFTQETDAVTWLTQFLLEKVD